MEKLRITYLSQAPLDGVGIGGGPRVKSIVDVLVSLGCNIDLIAYDLYSTKNLVEICQMNKSLNLFTVRRKLTSSRMSKSLSLLYIFPKLVRSCKNCDIILSDFNNPLSSIPAVLMSEIFDKPLILDCIDKKLINIIPDILYKYIAKKASINFIISPYLMRFFRESYGCNNLIYMPIFVNTDLFKKDQIARQEIRAKYFMSNEDTVIGYVGSFSYYEGVPILLKAFKKIIKKNKNVKLAIMGKVYWTKADDDLPRLIDSLDLKEYVTLIPSQNHDDVPKYLSAFDILCCPKIDSEINRAANPVKVVEYLSMGIPTVCSAIGGIIETIEDNKNGLLVEPGSIDDLYKKLDLLISNPEMLERLGIAGRDRALRNYSYSSLKERIEYSLNTILLNKRNK